LEKRLEKSVYHKRRKTLKGKKRGKRGNRVEERNDKKKSK
jgi:hypothetical protein